MTDFLQFLNNADLNTLTKIPGISRTVAGNIISARPFDFVEDCAKVRGMGKNLLGRAQSYFEEELNESQNSVMIPVEQEALPALTQINQPEERTADVPSFWSRLRMALINFLRALVRLVFIAALIICVGALLYYGLPYLNKIFVAPVEKNTAQINRLEANIATLQTQLSQTDQRVTVLETSINTDTASLEKLTEMQTSLETQLKDNNDKALLELKREVMMTRALDMLGRARLYLAQSNFGLAKDDVQNAHDLLEQLHNETNDAALAEVVARLDLALSNLPAFPVVASGDLEIAWQILMTGTPVNVVTETSTPVQILTSTPASLPTFTPTPFDIPAASPTP